MQDRATTGVLFVCLGNICRSPTAHGVFASQVAGAGLSNSIAVDSCGTGAWHVGEPPDARATAAAALRNYDLSALRARQLSAEDFERFDYILAMDRQNMSDVRALAPAGFRGQIKLLLDYAPQADLREVPDPYYGDGSGFDHVLDLVEMACVSLLQEIVGELAPQ